MLILLPPSESKQTRRRGRPLALESLSFPELTNTRERVLRAAAQTSERPDAASILGVSPSLVEEIARNTRSTTAPSLAAQDLYTGVLYDALDIARLDETALRRARRWIVIVSALYGAVRLRDRLAPYRLSMAVNLPGIGPLAAAWRPHLAEVLPAAAGRGVVVDCRSSTYTAAWQPTGPLAERWVQIRVPGATHMAKHTRGLVTRELCVQGVDARSPDRLAELLAERFEVTLHAPERIGRAWILDVCAPC